MSELLGGLSSAAFLRTYWQKKPLLVRQAIGGFRGLLSRAELFALATRDDVESRLIKHARGVRTLAQGPFRAADLKRLPPRGWTLLVQGVNLHVAAADALLRRFAFIPYARLDDVMVSYAAPGGGVGPHVDSYDVFLLQGEGRRRWQLGRQPGTRPASARHSTARPRDTQADPSSQVRILTPFRAEVECTLDAGDMVSQPARNAAPTAATIAARDTRRSSSELSIRFLRKTFTGSAPLAAPRARCHGAARPAASAAAAMSRRSGPSRPAPT